ncbi:MAG: tetratricopeptide repeat protein [Planctomycetes bacterium]|nr:tetratricopeptide repeat protein [Planctomycetota bacterium]
MKRCKLLALAVGALAPLDVAAARAPGSEPVSRTVQEHGGAPRASSESPTDATPTRERAVELLREDLELDRPRDALARGAAWVASGGAFAGDGAFAGGGAFANDGEIVALVARALTATGEDARARKLVDGAQASEATRGWLDVERARQALERDELEEAANALAGNPVKHPALAECWLVRARALARLGKAVEAAPLFQKFLELAPLSPDGPAACHQLAQAALASGKQDDAARWFARANELGTWHGFYRARRIQIREAPDDPLPRLGLAQLLLEAREYARAERVLDELVARHADFANGWFHLGEARRKQRDLAGARAAYDRALSVDATLAFARFNRGVIARMEGRDADARSDFERIVASDAGNDSRLVNAHLELARLLARAGDAAAATARYARYTELGGKEPLAEPRR